MNSHTSSQTLTAWDANHVHVLLNLHHQGISVILKMGLFIQGMLEKRSYFNTPSLPSLRDQTVCLCLSIWMVDLTYLATVAQLRP